MKNLYYIVPLIILGACSLPPNSEVVMQATSEKRQSKSEYMPPAEKPLKAPRPEEKINLPLAPQVGIRVPIDT